MAAAIGVRSDLTSTDLRRFARQSGDADQVRRLLAVAVILDGGSRSDAAKVAGVTLQIVRDWVLRFNEGGPGGLATRKAKDWSASWPRERAPTASSRGTGHPRMSASISPPCKPTAIYSKLSMRRRRTG